MSTPRRALISLIMLAAALSAHAQKGPIEPIVIVSLTPSGALAEIPDTAQDYIVPFEATIGPDGFVQEVVVTTPTGDAAVDATVVRYIKEKEFLPALDVNAQPMTGKVSGSVDFRSSTTAKELKASFKPPNTRSEVERVRKMTCKDFTWEVARLRNDGAKSDVSREIMPWVSLRVYMVEKKIGVENEWKYMPKWPAILDAAVEACEGAPAKLYLKDVLAPLLDKSST